MRDVTQTPPSYQISVTQLQCTACGAETHAACNCGVIYKPKALERAAEAVAAHPERSDRAIAAEIGVSHTTVGKARASTVHTGQLDQSRTGLDGRTRKLPIPDAERVRQKAGVLPPDPMQDADLTEQIVDLFQQLSRNGQVRCAIKLKNILEGRA